MGPLLRMLASGNRGDTKLLLQGAQILAVTSRQTFASLDSCCVQAALSEDPEEASCVCIEGWGGSGCNQQVTELTSNISQSVTGVPGGEWRYFSIYLQNQTATLVAEMRRARGDPILFLKGESEGEEVQSSSNLSGTVSSAGFVEQNQPEQTQLKHCELQRDSRMC